MNVYEEIARRTAESDLVSAERMARDLLGTNQNDALALEVLGTVLLSTGRHTEALTMLKQADALRPGAETILFNLGVAHERCGNDEIAAKHYLSAGEIGGPLKFESFRNAAGVLHRAGKNAEAFDAYVRAGVLSPKHHKYLTEPAELDGVEALSDEQVAALLALSDRVVHPRAVCRLAMLLWERRADVARESVAIELPSILMRLNRHRDAGVVYLETLQRGYPVVDFRPRWDKSALSKYSRDIAAQLNVEDRIDYTRRLEDIGALINWAPIVETTGTVVLRGLSRSQGQSNVAFDVWCASSNDWKYVRRISGTADSASTDYCVWIARIEDLLPGRDYASTICIDGATPATDESIQRFHVPMISIDSAVTVGGGAVGTDGAFFSGSVSAFGERARYRFEYGNDSARLDAATPWEKIPPPRNAIVRDVAYRHVGHWIPRSTEIEWIVDANHQGRNAKGARPVLELIAPFAKDRNQLNGIGSHEMPLNFGWGEQWPPSSKSGRTTTLSVDGGTVDLRDAEVSFTIQGVELEQRGAALTFWIDRMANVEGHTIWSQWALTSHPFPDHALEDVSWNTITLGLADNPSLWTYTGNNPKEQGDRARRYQRLALHETLAGNNAPFVLIFAFGPERDPPRGRIRIREVRARYRSHSLLAPAFGTKLIAWPHVGVCDPLNLSNCSRGYDESLWTSGPYPQYPMDFVWALSSPAKLKTIQVNQHPYWPAREVELWGTDPADRETHLWSGILPEGGFDKADAPYTRIDLDGPLVKSVKLRLASGYHAERCGLDGIELFGTGVSYVADGQACSVSANVTALTPGQTVYFRTVVDDDGEVGSGDIASLTIPKTQVPLLLSASPLVRRNNSAALNIRANAMGLETELWVERIVAHEAVTVGPVVSLGSQPTSRDILYSLVNLPQVGERLRLRARNTAGESNLEVEWRTM